MSMCQVDRSEEEKRRIRTIERLNFGLLGLKRSSTEKSNIKPLKTPLKTPHTKSCTRRRVDRRNNIQIRKYGQCNRATQSEEVESQKSVSNGESGIWRVVEASKKLLG